MATFIGFNTQSADAVRTTQVNSGADGGAGSIQKPIRYGKKYRLTDSDLVIQDFINALNIPQGQKPGRPEYGTTLWSFIFEPNTLDTRIQLEDEIRRVASENPRLLLNTVAVFPQDNGILIEVELSVTPFEDTTQLAIFFDQNTSRALGV